MQNLSVEFGKFIKNYICIDIETCDVFLKTKGPGARNEAYIVGVAISDGDYSAYYPLRHKNQENICKHKFQPWLQDLVNSKKYIIGANVLYDLEFLSYYGIDFTRNQFIDVQYCEALLDSSKRSYSLDTLARTYCGESKCVELLTSEYIKVFGKTDNIDEVYKHLSEFSIETVGQYAVKDAELTVKIWLKQKELIKKFNLIQVFDVEHKLIPILLKMRLTGVKLDVAKLHIIYKELNIKLEILQKLFPNVRIGSPKDIGNYFKSKGLNLPLTEKGHVRTDAYTLGLMEDNLYVKNILEARKIDKCLGTFIRNYIYENIYNEDKFREDRLYTQYHPLRTDKFGTVTGRFSSSNPNLQNIPVRSDDLTGQVRSLFIPETNSTWVTADYNQIEYRLTTNYAVGVKSEQARNAYISDVSTDFHKYVMGLTGVGRKQAKICNFLLIYGGSAARLQQALRSTYKEALSVYKTYHRRIPYIKSTYNLYYGKSLRNKEIRTLLNRRIKGSEADGYKGLNRFIQGSAADIIKIAMVELHNSGIFKDIGYPLMTVHDELDFSIPKDKVGMISELKSIMENSWKKYVNSIKIPLTVDISQGKNWGEVA